MKTCIVVVSGVLSGMLIATVGLQAQGEMGATASFQVFSNESGPSFKFVTMDQVNGPAVTGKPFSATEEHHTLQILGDGTRIEKTETDRLFRDSQGRTRMERPEGVVVIHDPLLGVTTESNGTTRNARVASFQRRDTGEVAVVTKGQLSDDQRGPAAWPPAPGGGGRSPGIQLSDDQRGLTTAKASIDKQAAERAMLMAKIGKDSPAAVEEDLGSSSVNGLIAQGTRQTTVIEAGQIGNDRPIRIVSERWYSNDLQLLVKSSNSDPRFGETTYQLTNISMAAPDPALFQVPSERKIGGQ